MKNPFLLILLTGIFVSLFLLPNLAEAQVTCPGTPCPGGGICIENPLCAEDFPTLINSIINFIFYIAIAIAPLMIIIAAFYFLTAAGNPQKIDTAKRIILWTVVGFAIILLAKGLYAMLEQIIVG